MSDYLTTREAADEIGANPVVCGGVYEWHVRRLFELGILPEPPKFGGKRIILRADLPRIMKAMAERGWIKVRREATPA